MTTTEAPPSAPERLWCPPLNAWVQVLERRVLFGRQVARVSIDGGSAIHTVPAGILTDRHAFDLPAALATVAGARIWSALGSDLFLAPLVSRVLPLPHQFRVLRRALGTFPARMMLADEVGMGKTIEAGLILKELKLRGMADRVLILAPKSLLLQWIVEMDTLFDEAFDLVLPGGWGEGAELRGENNWKRNGAPQVITSIDAVKPKATQRGWSADKIARYNAERFHDLVGAGWDLAILDEAHLLAGSSDDVARYELAKELSKSVPHLLLLTATPHSGKSDAFRRLLSLLDPAAFAGGASADAVQRYVIRTEKRSATDADGKPLFAPRITRLITVPFEMRHALQQQLYDAASEYVVESYKKAERGGGAKGSRLLLILIQRLVSSSTRAVRRFLTQRTNILRGGDATERFAADDDMIDAAGDELDLDELSEGVLFSVPAASDELAEVERLLALAVRVEATGPDARAEAMLALMRDLALEDGEPSKKFLVFTEFTATQEMLAEFLAARGYAVATLNGAMDLTQRRSALEQFRGPAQILISTDAGGVGLNMQFAHVVFNYDLPYAPMRVEQRIGRVDRIGQKRTVRAINLVVENSVEARLYDIWQTKLATILAELGVDKTGDVLDSSTDAEFERLARIALIAPETLDNEADRVLTEVRRATQAAVEARAAYTTPVEAADRPPTVPLRAWLDTLMVTDSNAPFRTDSSAESGEDTLSLDDLSEQVIRSVQALTPTFAQGTLIPRLRVSGLGFPLDGYFAVWKIGIAEGAWRQQHVFALYSTPDGETYQTAAQRLWDDLAARRVNVVVEDEVSGYPFQMLEQVAETEAATLFQTVVENTRERARRRSSALDLSYLARRAALARIELDTVREARRRELEIEYQQRKAETALAAEGLPDLTCLFLAQVVAE